jgi:hypothetical protein
VWGSIPFVPASLGLAQDKSWQKKVQVHHSKVYSNLKPRLGWMVKATPTLQQNE